MMTSYGVAKAAQDTLTKNLAFEFATKGVRVNSVLPGALPLGGCLVFSHGMMRMEICQCHVDRVSGMTIWPIGNFCGLAELPAESLPVGC